ncbi:MATE family efflux transporter [Clostridium sp. 'deep sea']|uniref:MATE family efflux transporter n=1 Tax=Clostridium sp. 'deep sea' TaxID=2779445 RepID=UPI0018967BC5|nr:MATE family efflux transporter [Clostridium sp. 'deep sea']QOR36317.1 MATE family efflux transporter [Clostridium sp. 'deep sea']
MRKRDLTKGSVINNLLFMALPAMLGLFTNTLYDIVDMMWIGRISATAVASVTVFCTILGLISVLNSIIGNGSVPVLAQSFGSADLEKSRKAVANTFAFKLIVGLVGALLLYLILKPTISLFTKDVNMLNGALEYGRIRTIFLPIMFSSYTVSTALRCSGDSKSPMYIAILASVLNIVLDPIFIFSRIPILGIKGLGLGIFGAALATVISTTVSFLIGFWILFGPKSKLSLRISDLFKIDWTVAMKITRIGGPQALANLLRNMANVIILGFVTLYGTMAVAAFGILGRIMGLMVMPSNGLVQGGGAVVGQNVGCGKIERAEKTALIAGKLGGGIMIVVSALGFVFAPQIMGLFSNEIEVLAIGIPAFRIAFLCLPILGFSQGIATLFIGTGYTLPFFIGGIVGQWLIQVPFLYLVSRVLHLPFTYIAASFIVYAIGEGLVTLYYYRSGKWRNTIEHNVSSLAASS